MTLAHQEIILISGAAALVLLHLLQDMLRQRSCAGFLLFSLLALSFALFLLEVIYLKLPLLDLALTVVMGVLGGLHLLSVLGRRKKRLS